MAFTGKYYNHKEDGTYTCAGCDYELFSSETKFDSGTGWPSFYQAVEKDRIIPIIKIMKIPKRANLSISLHQFLIIIFIIY